MYPEMFQFQTGAIKSANASKQESEQTRFNSKLVRLKAASSAKSGFTKKTRFNSKLVRLKVRDGLPASVKIAVSIPNWCD